MIWDSTIAQIEEDEQSVNDSIGSENKIKSTTVKTSIMAIEKKQKEISSKNNSFIKSE